MFKFTLAALAVWAGVAHAGVASDQAWSRFAAMRPDARADRTVDHFNRLVFSTYRNVALFAGPAASGPTEFLEDFLLHFPNTVVHAGHAALIDPDRLVERLQPTELNLVVLNERYLAGEVDLGPLFDRIDRLNSDGYVVKAVIVVNDADAVLPTNVVRRAEFFNFAPDYEAQLRRTVDDFTRRPAKSKIWAELIDRAQGRRKLAVLKLSQLVLDSNVHLMFMLGDASGNGGLVDEVQAGLGAVSPVIKDRSMGGTLVVDEPKRRLGLNLIRIKVGPDQAGQWPRMHEFWPLLHDVRKLNASGVHAKVIVESQTSFEVPITVRAQALVVTTARGCEGLMISR